MRRACLLTLSTMLLALAVAPAAQAERVFTVRGADGPGPARYDRVRVIEQGPRRAHHVLVLVPGTSAGAAFFRPAAADLLQAASGLEGVVGRPAREPARGPLDARRGAGSAAPARRPVPVLPRVDHQRVDQPALRARPRRRRAVRPAVGDEGGDRRPAQRDQGRAEGRQRCRARRPLARRLDRRGVRHVGLQRPRGRRRPRRARADRRRQRRYARHASRGEEAARAISTPRPRSWI